MARELPAVLGGTPLLAGRVPDWPIWGDEERAAVAEVLESGAWWQGDGRVAATFAAEFAAMHGARYGLALTNGTHALEAALVACGIGEGDEVIVPGMTFIASASAVMAVNATPVFVDIDPRSLCIDVAAAEAAITPSTRAVVAVHVAGAACDLDALIELCDRRGLALIEDCAHAHGTTWRGRGVGSWGRFGSFSMQQSKLMTAGEGGVLITNDRELRDAAWAYADCGRAKGEWFYHHATYGSNLRMTEWQGAVLGAQLHRFPEQHRTRNERARALDRELTTIDGVLPQARDPRMDAQGFYCYVFRYNQAKFAGLSLRGFEVALSAEGVPMGVSYPSLTELELFHAQRFEPRWRGRSVDVPHLLFAEHAAASTVWLQHRVLLADEDAVVGVARAVRCIQANAAAVAAEVDQ